MPYQLRRLSLPGTWDTTGSGGGTPPPPPPPSGTIPATAGLMIAASRPEVKNFSTVAPAGVTGANAQVPHNFPNGLGQRLMLCYDAFGVGWDTNTKKLWGNSGSYYDNPAGNPCSFSCALSEPDGSAFYQGHCVRVRHSDGTITDYSATMPTSITINGSDSADFVVDIGVASRPAGTVLTEHCFKSCTAGGSIFLHLGPSVGALSGFRNEACTLSAGEKDKSMQMLTSFPSASPATGAAWASSIRHIDSPPSALRHPTICIGDSLLASFGYGWGRYLAQNTVPYVNVARGTETGASWLGTPSTVLAALRRSQVFTLGGFTRAVIQYGTNDLGIQGLTLGNLTGRRTTMINECMALGALLVGVDVLPPNTVSTDNWATLAGQSLDMRTGGRGKNEAVRQAYNSGLLQGTVYGTTTPSSYMNTGLGIVGLNAAGAEEVIGTSADPTDTPQQIGKWVLDPSGNPTTASGLHDDTTAGETLWANAVPDNFFMVGG